MAIRTGSIKQFRSRQKPGQLIGLVMLSASIMGGALIIKSSSVTEAAPVEKKVIVAEFDTIRVPVPANYVPAGTKVSDIELKWEDFPKHQLPDQALTSTDLIKDSVTLASLPANLPLFQNNFSSAAYGSNPVLERIPAGMRAITIRVDATSAVEGWAGSGSIVDVLLIEQEQTSVVAELVKILSAERSVAPVDGNESPDVPSTVTLLVTQEQALAINTAIPRGRIAFALRRMDDEENWREKTFTSASLQAQRYARRTSQRITGYISVKDGGEKTSFALSAGKWIKTEVVPEGFRVGEEE